MPVMRDYQCGGESCARVFELCADLHEKVTCPGCGALAFRLPVGTRSYKIKGDNSASVTPKKHRTDGGS